RRMDWTWLRAADVVLLLVQLELTRLRNVVRMLLTLGTEDGLSDKVQIVINRVGCDFFDGAIGMKKAEETIGKPVFWQLPNDPKAMMSSRNAGIPLLQHAPRSKIQLSIASLADTLCGKGAVEEDKKKRSGFFSF